jgi:RNA polymerase sigma factor (sigma-70 family)
MQEPSFRWPPAEVLGQFVRDAQSRRAEINELLTFLRPALITFFQRRLAHDICEDLAQMACVRIAGAIKRIDPQRADSYIATVARNLLRTTYRRHARDRIRADETNPDDLPGNGSSADRRMEYEELVRAVHRACIEKLRPGLREVAFGLLQGETPVEIARQLDISPITVRTRLLRVRAILRDELGPYLESDARLDRRPP